MLGLLLARIILLCAVHAVHISYGDLSISGDTLKGNFTFYEDDWDKATERWFGRSMATQTNALQAWMKLEYLKAHVRFWLDGFSQPIAIDPKVKDESGQSVTYEFISVIPPNHRAIIIDSRAGFAIYSDQMNLVTVTVKDKTENIVFTSDHMTSTLKL